MLSSEGDKDNNDEVRGGGAPWRQPSLEGRLSFVETLARARKGLPQNEEPDGFVRLKGLRGTAGSDGIERVTSQSVFDFLGLKLGQRTTGQARRIASAMRELGWTPIRLISLNQRGNREHVRGYARQCSARL